jgi:hypothetical protein
LNSWLLRTWFLNKRPPVIARQDFFLNRFHIRALARNGAWWQFDNSRDPKAPRLQRMPLRFAAFLH